MSLSHEMVWKQQVKVEQLWKRIEKKRECTASTPDVESPTTSRDMDRHRDNRIIDVDKMEPKSIPARYGHTFLSQKNRLQSTCNFCQSRYRLACGHRLICCAYLRTTWNTISFLQIHFIVLIRMLSLFRIRTRRKFFASLVRYMQILLFLSSLRITSAKDDNMVDLDKLTPDFMGQAG